MTSPTNSQYLNIDPSISLDLFLIIRTKLYHILSFYLSIWNVNVFFGYVDMIEEMVVHVVVVRLRVIIFDRIVFIKVECHHIFKTEIAVFVQTNEFSVDANGSAPCG